MTLTRLKRFVIRNWGILPPGRLAAFLGVRPQEVADAILRHFDLLEFFDRIFGSNLDGRLADKRELLEHAQQITGFSVASSALVGDRGLDISAARSHGILAIGALWGYGNISELEAAGDLVAQLLERDYRVHHQLAGQLLEVDVRAICFA